MNPASLLRVALLCTPMIALSAVAASADPPIGVVHLDEGAGHRTTIVTDGGRDRGDEPPVLSYTDGAGRAVRVYADHPVSRGEAERELADARRQGAIARAEGRRAAEEGRRAAAEGRREAVMAREEGRRGAEEGRRAAEEGRRAAEEARREAGAWG